MEIIDQQKNREGFYNNKCQKAFSVKDFSKRESWCGHDSSKINLERSEK